MSEWPPPEKDALQGTVYVCSACGKTSKNKYGAKDAAGWDESCTMHAVLCKAEREDVHGTLMWIPVKS